MSIETALAEPVSSCLPAKLSFGHRRSKGKLTTSIRPFCLTVVSDLLGSHECQNGRTLVARESHNEQERQSISGMLDATSGRKLNPLHGESVMFYCSCSRISLALPNTCQVQLSGTHLIWGSIGEKLVYDWAVRFS